MSTYIHLIDVNTKKGTRYDVTPLFTDYEAFSSLVEDITSHFRSVEFEYVAGIDALGFILGTAVAIRARKGFVAIADGQMVGSITVYVKSQPNFWEVKKVGSISGIMVSKAYRRQGIARQLLEHAKAFFAEKGVRYFTVFTAIKNKGALTFYEQNSLYPIYVTMMGELNG